MEKSLSLQVKEFEDGLLDYINSSPLPVIAKLMSLKLLMPDVITALTKANVQLVQKEKDTLKQNDKSKLEG